MGEKMIVIAVLCLLLGGCGSGQEYPGEKEVAAVSAESGMDQTAKLIMDDLFVDDEVQLMVYDSLGITEYESESSILSKLEECESLILNRDISSLEDLALLPSLKELTIQMDSLDGSKRLDFTPVAGLEKLKTLEICYKTDSIMDYSFVTKLASLENLYLPECGIRDIAFLGEVYKLKRLSLYGNDVGDLTPLEGLSGLVELSLGENGSISNVAVIGGLLKMEDLDLQYCNVSDINFMADLKELKCLNINGNQVTNLSVLKDLTKLERLRISDNGIEDISALINLENMCDLQMGGNKIEDLGVLQGMDELFFVNVSGNPLKSLKPVYQVPLVRFYPEEVKGGDELKNEGEWVRDWMKQNVPKLPPFNCIDYSSGDLNQDGLADIAFVVDELPLNDNNVDTGADREGELVKENRFLYLLLQNSDGTYQSAPETPYTIASQSDGKREDPYCGIFMDDGRLVMQERNGGASRYWTLTTIYRYENDKLTATQELYAASSGYNTMGYEVTIILPEKGTWQRYAYAIDGYGLTGIFLEDDKHPYFKAFPEVSIDKMNFHIYDTPRKTQKSPEDALELVKDMNAPEAEKEMLPYTDTLKTDLERLKGISLPDDYYTVAGEVADNPEDYFYYNGLSEYDHRLVHEIYMVHWERYEHASLGFRERESILFIDDETGELWETGR